MFVPERTALSTGPEAVAPQAASPNEIPAQRDTFTPLSEQVMGVAIDTSKSGGYTAAFPIPSREPVGLLSDPRYRPRPTKPEDRNKSSAMQQLDDQTSGPRTDAKNKSKMDALSERNNLTGHMVGTLGNLTMRGSRIAPA